MNYLYSFLVLRLEVGVHEAIGVNLVDWSYKLHLFRPTQHRYTFVQILPLLVGWVFRPVLRPSSGMSIQISYKERHNNVDAKGHLTYLLTPWCRVLLEKLTGLQLVKKLPAFHKPRRFITALTSVHHLSLSWASPIQSIHPHPTSWRSILITSIHLRLGIPSGLLPSGFPTKTLYTPLSSPISATCPAHLILLEFITRTILGEEYKSFVSSLCNLLHSPVTCSLLGLNILLNTMFSNTLSFLSSCNGRPPYLQSLFSHNVRT